MNHGPDTQKHCGKTALKEICSALCMGRWHPVMVQSGDCLIRGRSGGRYGVGSTRANFQMPIFERRMPDCAK